MSVLNCLKKLDKAFSPQEQDAIRGRYLTLLGEGLSEDEASTRLVDQLLAEAKQELANATAAMETQAKTADTAAVSEPGAAHERDAGNVQDRKRGARSGAAKADTRDQLDLFSASAVSAGPAVARLQFAANFATRVESEVTRTVQVSTDHIHSADDAAAVFLPFRDRAQETFLVALVDKAGKVLEVAQHSIGRTDSATVELMPVAGMVAKNPDAVKVWVSHNHPSGNAEPSNADRQITDRLGRLLRDIGVELTGHVILGRDDFSELDEAGSTVQTHRPYFPADAKASVPITERNIAHRDTPKHQVTSPAMARHIARQYNDDGVLLLNNQHEVVGFLAIAPAEMKALRANNSEGARRVTAAIETANAPAAIVVTKTADPDAADNIGNMMSRLETRVLDYIALDTSISAAERGASVGNASAPFYSRPNEPTWYYSPLQRAVEGLKQETAPAAQWQGMIAKLPGIKPEEIEWTGLNDWLKLQQGKVTKAQILDYLNANGVQVQEVEKAVGRPEGWRVIKSPDVEGEWDVVRQDGRVVHSAPSKADAEVYLDSQGTDNTKYSSYVLPGGENYRELLLTLPTQDEKRQSRLDRINDEAAALPPHGERTQEQQRRFEELVAEHDAVADAPRGDSYHSSHWDEPNILAHVRFNTRTDADGNKVLFIEEIQSDWAQEGKKKGFKGQLSDEQVARELGLTEEWDDIPDERRNVLRGMVTAGVPSAPFVTKTDAWVALAIKRMIRYASENGFDRVAFVNGEQSAQRYSLSKQVNEISWRVRRGSKSATLELKNGDQHTFHVDGDGQVVEVDGTGNTTFIGKSLADVIGKDVASKVMAEEKGLLSGDGLNIGGEGMKAFYDKIVPTVAKDVLKKLGGGKLEPVRFISEAYAMAGRREDVLSPAEHLGFDITPEMRERALAGLPLFSRAKAGASPVSLENLSQLAAGIKQAEGWPDAVSVNVVASWDALPAHLANQVQQDGATDLEGIWDPVSRSVYLVQQNLSSPKRAAEVLFHEMGHAGLQLHLGARRTAILTSVYNDNENVRQAADKLRQAFGYDIARATEEALADLNGVEAWKQLTGWRKLVAAFRSVLRGLADKLPAEWRAALAPESWTDDDVLYLLSQAAQRLRDMAQAQQADTQMAEAYAARPADDPFTYVAATWKALSPNQALYRIPVSDKTDLAGIFGDIDPSIRVSEGTAAEVQTARNTTGKKVIRVINVEMPREVNGHLVHDPVQISMTAKEVWINAAALKESVSGGSRVYAAVGNFAYNTGRVFIGDPLGLSDLALIRRTENMLSLAIKFGTTRFLHPHEKQLAPAADSASKLKGKVQPLDWRVGDDEHNLVELARRSYDNVVAFLPEIQNVELDPVTGRFVDIESREPVSDARWDELGDLYWDRLREAGLPLDAEEDARAGSQKRSAGRGPIQRSATLKRAAFAHSLVRRTSPSARRGFLAFLSGKLSGGIDGQGGIFNTDLTRVLYSRPLPDLSVATSFTLSGGNAGAPGVAGESMTWKLPPETRLQLITRKLQNRMNRVLTLQNAIRKSGGAITETLDVDLKERRFSGEVAAHLERFHQKAAGELLRQMAARGISQEELDTYLYARHAPERNARIEAIRPDVKDGSGMSDQTAAEIIVGFDRAGKLKDLRELEPIVRWIADYKLMLQEEAGLIEPEQADLLRNRYQFYVPLKGWEEKDGLADPGNWMPSKVSKGYQAKTRQIVSAMGRRSKADSPIAVLLHDTEATIIAKHKNDVGKTVLALAREFPNRDEWQVIETPHDLPPQPMLVNGEVVLRRRHDALYADDPQWGKPLLVKEDGKLVGLRLKDDTLRNALQGMDDSTMGPLSRFVGSVTRKLSAVRTSLNPEFVINNFIADTQTALFSLLGERDKEKGLLGGDLDAKGKEWMKREFGGKLNFPKKLLTVTKAVVAIGQQRWADDAGQVARSGSDSLTRWIDLYNEMRHHGGETGIFGLRDVETIKKEMAGLIKMHGDDIGAWPRKAFHKLRHIVETMNGAVEGAWRLIAYGMAREAWGLSPEKAAYLSRTLTVDFNRRGEWKALSAWYMFFNAGVQGASRWIKMQGRKGVQLALAAFAGLSFLVGMWNHAVTQTLPDGRTAYEAIATPNKASYFMVLMDPDGKTAYTLRLPHGTANIVWNVGAVAADAAFNKNSVGPRYAWSIGTLQAAVGNAFNPLGGMDGNTFLGGIKKMLAPTILDPVIELDTNVNAFGTPIYKQPLPWETQPLSSMGRAKTSQVWHDVAKGVNRATGGDDYESGAVDYQPEVYRYWWQFATGGMGTFWDRATNYAAGKWAGEDIDAGDVPFKRSLVAEPPRYDVPSLYFTYKKAVENAQGDWKTALGRHDRNYKESAQNRLLRLMFGERLKLVEKQLKAQRQRLDDAQAKGDRLRADEAEKRMHATMQQFISQVRARMEAKGLAPLDPAD